MNRSQRFIRNSTLVCSALLLLSTFPLAADNDWLPIPAADLALKDNPASPGANAMILYRESDMDSNTSSAKEYFRIKVFTQEGTRQGDIEIPFIRQNADIKDIRGRTVQPDGTIINFDGKIYEKTIVKASGIKFLAKTFTLPDVHPGSIIEYKFREQSDPRLYVNESWTITNSLYTRDAHFTIKPEAADHPTLPLSYRQFGLPQHVAPVRQPNGTFTMDIHDIAGLEDEDLMPPERTLQVRVDFFYNSFGDPANETPDHFWNRKGKLWADEIDRFTSKKGALEKDLSATIAPGDSDEVKLRKIYARAQKIRNLSMEDAKTEKEQKQEQIKPNASVEDVIKHNYGNGREVNFLFLALARTAGFSAAEVYVAPRNVNFFLPNTLDASQLSADIVWVHTSSRDYYLDPASAAFPFGILPWYETNTRGLRCTKDGGEIVTIPPALPSQSAYVRTADIHIDSEGEATGTLQVDITGQLAADSREENRAEDEAGRRKTINDEITAWLPTGSTFDLGKLDNWKDNNLPLHIEGTVKIPNFGTSAGRRILVPASIFHSGLSAAFRPEKRLYPVYFSSPYEDIDETKFHVPEGFKIEAVPASNQVKPGFVSYEISSAQQNNIVVVKRHLVIDGMIFPVTSYAPLRSFFNQVKSNDDAQIVLQDAETAKN